jgi:hypothetical protein
MRGHVFVTPSQVFWRSVVAVGFLIAVLAAIV